MVAIKIKTFDILYKKAQSTENSRKREKLKARESLE